MEGVFIGTPPQELNFGERLSLQCLVETVARMQESINMR